MNLYWQDCDCLDMCEACRAAYETGQAKMLGVSLTSGDLAEVLEQARRIDRNRRRELDRLKALGGTR
jgi:hypothetical protein